jgi:hypothetical protein
MTSNEWQPEPKEVSLEEFMNGLDDPPTTVRPPRKTTLHRAMISQEVREEILAKLRSASEIPRKGRSRKYEVNSND